jgi:hypothetical protein
MDINKELQILFESRTDVYAECWWSIKSKRYAYKSIKKPLTSELIEKHISDPKFDGIGIYPIIADDMTKWIAADFDIHNDKEKEEVEKAMVQIYQIADGIDCSIYKEISKSGNGVHLWIFFSDLVKSWKARKFFMAILESAQASHLSSMDRLFPSQDKIFRDGKKYGNLIHMPFSAKFIKDGTYFEDRDGEKFTNKKDDIELFLEEVIPHTPEYLDAILDSWGLTQEIDQSLEYETDNSNYEYAPDAIVKLMDDPFIRWCRENPKEVDYNAWFAMITNLLPLGEDGIKAIHSISQMDIARYSHKATQEKIIACQGSNPVTYNWIIANTNFKEKEDVPYKSPIVAGIKYSQISSPIKEKMGKYYLLSGKKESEICNFLMIPVAYVSINNTIERLFDFKTQTKIIKNVAITSEMLASVDKFRTSIMSKSHDVLFYGTGNGLLRLVDYLNQTYPSVQKITGKQAIGIHMNRQTGRWVVLTQTSAWDSIGQVDDLVYYNNSHKKEITHASHVKIIEKDILELRDHLFRFNDFPQVAAILGWMFSLVIKQRLYELKGLRFPVLMIHGQAGSGKTETAKHIVKRFFGDIGSMNVIGDLTPFAFLSLTGSSNMFPIYLDEYKPATFSGSKKNMVSQMVRSLYDNSSAMRGQKDLTTVEFPIIAPAVICGETGFNEPALVERSIDVFLSKEDSRPYLESFLALKKLPLSALGNAYLNWTLQLDDNHIIEIYRKEVGDSHDRPAHNIAMVKVGLELLGQFFKSFGVDINVDVAKVKMEEMQIAHQKETGDTASVVDNILAGIFDMVDLGLLDDELISSGHYNGEIGLYIRGIYPQFKKWARETDFEFEIIPHNEFIRQVKKMNYFIDFKNVRFNDKVKKGYVFDQKRLIEKDILNGEIDSGDMPL